MAFVEVEIAQTAFCELIGLVLTSAPMVPTPTLPVFGDARLISRFQWGSPVLIPGLGTFAPPAGRLLATSPLTVTHVSLVELRANPNAAGVSSACTGIVQILVVTGRIVIEMIAIVVGNQPPQFLPAPVRVNQQELSGALADVAIASAALLSRDGIVTMRLATQPSDDVLAPTPNRLAGVQGKNWLVHVAGEVFVERLLASVHTSLSPPPDGTVIEEAPTAAWTTEDGRSQVKASVGLKKVNVCPTLFEKTDISVEVTFRLWPQPDPDADNLTLRLEVETNASDWDAFRCWLGTGFLAGLLIAAVVHPIAGLAAGFGSLIGIGKYIGDETEKERDDLSTSGFTKVDSGDEDAAAFESVIGLPGLPRASNRSSTVGPEGLIVTGLSLFLDVGHEIELTPADRILAGSWGGTFSCSLRHWSWTLRVANILLRDHVVFRSERVRRVPVRVFSSSVAEPASNWSLKLPFTEQTEQSVGVISRGDVSGQEPFIVVHSSTGIAVFTMPSIGARPDEAPTGLASALGKYCDTFVEIERRVKVVELKWSEPPPVYDFGIAALRQWQIVIESPSAPGSVMLRHSRGGESHRADAAVVSLPTDGVRHAAIELVTDGSTTMVATHSVETATFGARVMQRWLLPRAIFPLPSVPTAMKRLGDRIEVSCGRVVIVVSTRTLQVWRQSSESRAASTAQDCNPESQLPSNVRSITVRDGTVVAVRGSELIIATPYSSVLDAGRRPCC